VEARKYWASASKADVEKVSFSPFQVMSNRLDNAINALDNALATIREGLLQADQILGTRPAAPLFARQEIQRGRIVGDTSTVTDIIPHTANLRESCYGRAKKL
jgi:hypothetical protein